VLSLPDYFHLFIINFLFTMAIIVNPQEELIAWEAAGSDLVFLMSREGVDKTIQGKLYHIGVTSVKQFAAFAEDKGELRRILKENFEVDAAADISARVKISKVLVAWDSAKARAAKLAEADGDAEARHIPKEITSSDGQAMRATYEAKYGELSDREIPGRSYLERKLDEIEKSEFRAELLTEVVSREEDEPDSIKTVWSPNGELKAVKMGAKVSLPSDTESLRKRLALLGTAWLFVASHQAHRGYLRGITPALFQEYTSYLLGDYVLGMVARDSSGSAVSSSSWSLLVSYEHAVRVKAMQLVRKGTTFSAALKTAWEDPLTKERHFTTPLALDSVKFVAGSSQRMTAPPGNLDEPASKKLKALTNGTKGVDPAGKGGGKGKTGKGKGKGKNKINAKTPDGKYVCFNYNKAVGCSHGTACKFQHVCGKCFAPGITMLACQCSH
jgi:hypothetical protein